MEKLFVCCYEQSLYSKLTLDPEADGERPCAHCEQHTHPYCNGQRLVGGELYKVHCTNKWVQHSDMYTVHMLYKDVCARLCFLPVCIRPQKEGCQSWMPITPAVMMHFPTHAAQTHTPGRTHRENIHKWSIKTKKKKKISSNSVGTGNIMCHGKKNAENTV